ncbi:PRC-barrel domain-containing protein [Bosea sp. BK604]|uniref:PRC-barrel domain-containing protein n=1 Tax=Bosea sp. BK604 TaxID=2512180 RepID=UPI001046193C|nr:PRC-barrel domain-containing protein [Bosea sp. BK604]
MRLHEARAFFAGAAIGRGVSTRRNETSALRIVPGNRFFGLSSFKGSSMRTVVFALAASLLSTVAMSQTAPTLAQGPAFTEVNQASALGSSLKGLNVRNAGDENVGEIEDLVVVGNTLASYILSVGGFLGMGTHYVAVRPDSIAITWNEADKKWNARINATKDQLKSAPQFKYEGRFAK